MAQFEVNMKQMQGGDWIDISQGEKSIRLKPRELPELMEKLSSVIRWYTSNQLHDVEID